jgi:hypothetical protein
VTIARFARETKFVFWGVELTQYVSSQKGYNGRFYLTRKN